jgi:hypothetical protein
MVANRSRGVASALCATLGILLILSALLLGYARRSLFNEWAFSARVAASLEDPRVAGYVAEQITDAVIGASPDLVGLRPVLVGLSREIVSSAPFRATFRRAARVAHHAYMSGSGTEALLTVKDVGAIVKSAAATQPGLEQKIPPKISAALGELKSLPGGERAARLVRFGNRLRAGAFALLLLGLALCAASVWISREKRRAIVRIGITFMALGLVLVIVARFGGNALALFVRHAEMGPAVAGVTAAFLGGLSLWAAGLGFTGLVLAAASASLLERVPLLGWADGARAWCTGPQPLIQYRLGRGLLGIAVGAAILIWPLASLVVAVLTAGVVVAFAGLREAFAAALHMLPRIERRGEGAAKQERTAARRAVAMVATFAAVLVALAAWLVLRTSATPPETDEITACNGSPALCDRRLDQVVFPTTHNSMAGADVPGWMFPNQSAGIQQQLQDGIRGFLIDAHYATPVGDRVKTELQDEKAAMTKYEAAVGKEGVEAALRIRDRLVGEKESERDVYMCHGFCELGALKLVPVLRDIRDFLVANPGEVLIIVIQDESVAPQDIERCFRESGLIDFVYRGPARPPWPTLREMVESDQRVLVMAENESAGVDWYHQAFEVMQETPYSFKDPSEFSNRPNRGGPGGSLLLLNHWIESAPMPKPSNAAIVNARDALLARVSAFERERGRLPNLLAVDFYGVGDLIPVVRELNARPLPAAKKGRR